MRRRQLVAIGAAAALALVACEGESGEPGPQLGELDDSAIDPTDPPDS